MFGSVRFRFLKPETDWTEPNWTGSTSQHLKKITINRIFSNPKVTFTHQSPPLPSLLCISYYLSLYSPRWFFSPPSTIYETFVLLWLLSGKHGFLRKQRLINNGFFMRDVCLFVFVGSGGWIPDPLSPFLVVSCSSPLWFLGFPFLWSLGSLLFCLSGFVSSFPLWFYKAKPREKFDLYLSGIVILYADNYYYFFALCLVG